MHGSKMCFVWKIVPTFPAGQAGMGWKWQTIYIASVPTIPINSREQQYGHKFR